MKNALKYVLQKLLGFRTYLYLFSIFKIKTLKWDKNENDFYYFLKLLENDSIVLDIGANIGIMAAHLSRKCKEVIAYEPMPDNLFTLKKIVNRFALKNVMIREVALGSNTGEIEMILPDNKGVKMQGLSHVAGASEEDSHGKVFKVPLIKLDEDEILKNKRIDAIKMDVENYEYEVLRGAVILLKQQKPLIYTELWDNDNRVKCFDLLSSLGYNTRVLHNGELVNYLPKEHTTQNFFFIPAT